jgi:membrane-associated phospholipid phosphatase
VTLVRTALTLLLLAGLSAGAQAQCLSETGTDLHQGALRMKQATQSIPHAMGEPHNLKWELPVAAATAVLITSVDSHAARQFTSPSTISHSNTASNAALGAEIALAAVPYIAGCATGREHARHAGLVALEGLGYGLGIDGMLKLATNRRRPTPPNTSSSFWEGGKSFPSAHASASWAVASALAHQYPDKPLLKWGAYGLAATASILRIPARKHFPSDVLAGGTLGYLVGAAVSSR